MQEMHFKKFWNQDATSFLQLLNLHSILIPWSQTSSEWLRFKR